MDAMLEKPVGHLALCWRLARADGVVLGFTSHDRDLRLAGVTYRGGPGMTPSAAAQTEGLKGDSMSIEGVLDASSITAFDLESGRWRGASVDVIVCDWTEPEAGHMRISRGRIGDVSRPPTGTGGAFRLELLTDVDLSAALLPLRLSPTCRHELGDGGCGVSLDGRRIDWPASWKADDRLKPSEGLSDLASFVMGWVRIIEGRYCGIDRQIIALDGDELVLAAALPDAWANTVKVRLTPGCDKRPSTCQLRFGNARMFGGEPYVPGTDALLRYARS
jgi:uncharacterized phage protein (TIGR02218 family)